MRLLLFLLGFLASPVAAAEVCIDPPYIDAQGAEGREIAALYREVAPALDRFPSLARAIAARSPQLCVSSRMNNAQGYLDVEQNRIYLRRGLGENMQLGILVHEIRHLDQLMIGACPSDDLSMKEYALATLALEADASAISLLVAWDMKERGDPRLWSALSEWDSQSDIAARFAQEMAASGDIERAVSAAFDQWFASEDRRELYYISTCSGYLDRQEASKALPRYQLMPASFLNDLCKLPDGRSYACSKPE